MRVAQYVVFAALVMSTGCGGETRTIWPPLGSSLAATLVLEDAAGCELFTWTESEKVDVLVRYDNRECGHAGAGPEGDHIRVSVNDPVRCPRVESLFGLGLAVHELIHALGHWGHDDERNSVMNATLQLSWYIDQQDKEWMRTKCLN